MKLLLNPTLMQISEAISGERNEAQIDCRIESYSCKMIAQEKKMFKSLLAAESSVSSTVLAPGLVHSLSPHSLSPSTLSGSFADAPPDVLQHTCSTRTLYYLKATLNTVFAPDYDFSTASATEFSKEPSVDFVSRNLYGHLATALGDDVVGLTTALWTELEKEINPAECAIYSYRPDGDSDPFGEEGSLWSLNYFIYNKKLKRIVFIRASSCSTGIPSEDEQDLDGEDLDMSDDEMESVDPGGYGGYGGGGGGMAGFPARHDLSYME